MTSRNDELYELSQDAFDFLVRCSQGERPPVKKEDEEFIQYCLAENLITLSEKPAREVRFLNPLPSPPFDILNSRLPTAAISAAGIAISEKGPIRICRLRESRRFWKSLRKFKDCDFFSPAESLYSILSFWEINDILQRLCFSIGPSVEWNIDHKRCFQETPGP